MVFESLVVELLNKFLGDYVENLDASQLKLGIFGGDVTLGSLEVKPTALDDLDLPVKLKSGHLGKLNLKIPWRNLYKEAVEAEIDGLYILVVPNKGIVYNEEKESKYAQDAKTKKLSEIEEARKAKKQKAAAKGDDKSTEASDSFAEKMATQIIRNLQVTVKHIHVRYEDEYSNRDRAFAAGMTLDSLFFQTTDENWKPCIITEAIDQIIHKVIDMNSASVYWNSDTELLSRLEDRTQIRDKMVESIANNEKTPPGFNYVLKPISLSAHLKLNQKPERDTVKFSRPKIDLALVVPDVGVSVGKLQYQDVLLFLESLERMNTSTRYRKYRPDLVGYKGHYRKWWHFARDSIIEEQIRRRRRNWSWERMKAHRDLVRAYTNAWVDKQTKKSPSKESIAVLERAEKEMDVFNLNIARQQAEIEIDRRGLSRLEDQKTWGGWASSWFGGGKAPKQGDIVSQFNDAMSEEEKAKLYDALDYTDGEKKQDLPKEYVAVVMSFCLKHFTVTVQDDLPGLKKLDVMKLNLSGVTGDINQRPSADGLKISAAMESFGVEGLACEGKQAPSMVTMGSSLGTPESNYELAKVANGVEPLLTANFETNPLDGACDQKIKLKTHPINVIYHADTVNKLAVVFRPPESVALKQLTAAAMAKYENIKELSATGLEHALKKRTVMDVDIDIQPTNIVIPEKGEYSRGVPVLVVDLGSLKITTEGTGKTDIEAAVAGKSEKERYEYLFKMAYDNFRVDIKSFQILFAGPDEDWRAAKESHQVSRLHILEPVKVSILLQRCTIVDIALAKFKVKGELPDVSIGISDQRLLDLLKLLVGIPTPEPSPQPPSASDSSPIVIPEPTLAERAKLKTIMEVQDAELADEFVDAVQEQPVSPQTQQQTNLELDVSLQKIGLTLRKGSVPMIQLGILRLGAQVKQRSNDMTMSAQLGSIDVQYPTYKAVNSDGPLFLVENPKGKVDGGQPLISLEMLQADPSNPDFMTTYNMTALKLTANIGSLHVNLHRDALMELQAFGNELSAQLAAIQLEATAAKEQSDGGDKPTRPGSISGRRRTRGSKSSRSRSQSISSVKSLVRQASKRQASRGQSKLGAATEEDIIQTMLVAKLDEVLLTLCSSQTDNPSVTLPLGAVVVRGLESQVFIRKPRTELTAVLAYLGILDLARPGTTLHPTILSVVESEDRVFNLEVVQFTRTDTQRAAMKQDDVDVALSFQFRRMRFIFLNVWLDGILKWVKPFQTAAAEKAAHDAKIAAVENASAAAQQLYKSALKLRLDVRIDAPVIVMPKCSTSPEAIVVDLGNLIVKNKFTNLTVPSSTVPAVIDDMMVELSDVTIARAIMSPAGGKKLTDAEVRILEPLTFNMAVGRNLSFDFYKDRPEILVDASLPVIRVGVSQEDYATLLMILKYNLGETSDIEMKHASPPQHGQGTDLDELSSAESTPQDGLTPDTPQPTMESGMKQQLSVSFKMEGIEAALFMGSSNLDAKGIIERDTSRALAKAEITTVDVWAGINVNGALTASLVVVAVTLDDMRTDNVGSITRLMDKRDIQPSNADTNNNFLDVAVDQDSSQNQNVNVKLKSFLFCVSAEFLAAVGVFFSPPATDEDDGIDVAYSANSQQIAKKKAPSLPPSRRKSTFILTVVIEEPEIMILEDARKPEDTKALILKFQMGANVASTPNEDSFQARLDGLELFSSFYLHEKRNQYYMPVLKPVSMFAIGKKLHGQGLSVDVSISDFIVKVSPPIIQLLSGVAASYAKQQAATHQEIAARRPKPVRDVWKPKKVSEANLHCIDESCEVGEIATEELEIEIDDVITPDVALQEQLILRMETFILTLEAGIGTKTVPLILLESSVTGDVNNWSTKLKATLTLTLEMAYYNEKFSVWESLIEPVEDGSTYRPWELSVTAQKCSELDVEDPDAAFQPPEVAVAVISTDMLQMTVTKSAIDCLKKLGEVFSDAAKQVLPSVTHMPKVDAPYLLSNNTGLDLYVIPTDTLQVVTQNQISGDGVPLSVGETVGLRPIVADRMNSARKESVLRSQNETKDLFINVQFPSLDNTIREIDVGRAETRFFGLPKVTHPGDTWAVVAHVTNEYGVKSIIMSSFVQIHNHMAVDMEIYCLRSKTNLELCGRVEPDRVVDLPLAALYTPSGELFFRPVGDMYETSMQPVNWRVFQANLGSSVITSCGDVNNPDHQFFIQVYAEQKWVLFENSSRTNDSCQAYMVHLRPPVSFNNMLPVPITIKPPDVNPFVLEGGDGQPLNTVCPAVNSFKVEMVDYQNVKWVSNVKVDISPDELSAVTFLSESGKKMDIAIHAQAAYGSFELTLFCPFWVVNKTAQDIVYKGVSEDEGIEHSADFNKPMLLSFRGKNMFGAKKAQVRVRDSGWSDKFPLDVVGSAGRVTCKSKDGRVYDVCCRVTLGYAGLTKLITFTPFYMLDNRSTYTICVRESNSDFDIEWIKISPKDCVPLWPRQTDPRKMALSVKYDGTDKESISFPFAESYEALLRLDNQYNGIHVACNVADHAVIVTFEDYADGQAAALLVNATDDYAVQYAQGSNKQQCVLPPQMCQLFTWDSLFGKRELLWTCGDKKNVKEGLYKDCIGEFNYDNDTVLYFVSFLQGRQRVLLFSTDLAVVTLAQQAYELERVATQLTLSMQGVGFSLVNNLEQTEILYLSMTSSGIVWESKKNKRFKPLSCRDSQHLEGAFTKYSHEEATGKVHNEPICVDKMQVDFKSMTLLKPHERAIRRSFQTGLWVQLKMSEHQLQLHAKIQKLQIDNQLEACVFHTIFATVPPPKSVAAESIPKPFAEVSMVMRKAEVPQIKYFKVLVQEMDLKADQGFLNALLGVFATDQMRSVAGRDVLEKDVELTQTDLMTISQAAASSEEKKYFDCLHFSPLMVHLSFSQGGASTEDRRPSQVSTSVSGANLAGSSRTGQSSASSLASSVTFIPMTFVSVLLKSVGVTVTELQDVIFKLAYFERVNVFMNQQQLVSCVIDHYTKQAIKQFYVLVLGLDVIGNPFGLVRNLGEGVQDLFYEPIQGAIQGPEEFTEGLALGVRSLFGHAVGGAAGAVGRITGTLGKGIAALTMDDEYQRKRQAAINRRPRNFQEGMAQSGKGLVTGVFDGVTGVFLKPVEGAKQEGAAGFVKGVGKGLIGLVARPAGGVVDFASGSLDAVRRVADVGEEIKRVRLPRFLRPDLIVRPYNTIEAEGNSVLLGVEKGYYTKIDTYFAHAPLTQNRENIFIVTSHRVMMVFKSAIFGQWDCAWQYPWDEIGECPHLTTKGLQILLKEPKKKLLGFIGKGSAGKVVNFPNRALAEYMLHKTTEAYKSASL